MKAEDTNLASRWVKSIPGEALMIFGLAETVEVGQTQVLWIMILFGVIAAFFLRLLAGIPGRLRQLGPGLLGYSISIAIQAFLYGLALFGDRLDLSNYTIIFTAAGILISALLTALLGPDDGYDLAKAEYGVAVNLAEQGGLANVNQILQHLRNAATLDKRYIDRKRLMILPQFSTLMTDDGFKDYYANELKDRHWTIEFGL